MAIDLDTMKSELLMHLGIKGAHPDFDSDAQELLINRSFWEIHDKLHLRIKQDFINVALTAHSNEFRYADDVDYPFPESIISVSLIQNPDDPTIGAELNGRSVPLKRIDVEEYESIHQEGGAYEGAPTRYSIFRYDFLLDPTPDKAYGLRVYYNQTARDYFNGTEEDIPAVLGEIVLYGAVFRGFTRLRDFVGAAEFRNMQIGLVNSYEPAESKDEQANVKDNGLIPIRPAYRV